jgi:hypothetical protein
MDKIKWNKETKSFSRSLIKLEDYESQLERARKEESILGNKLYNIHDELWHNNDLSKDQKDNLEDEYQFNVCKSELLKLKIKYLIEAIDYIKSKSDILVQP